MVRVWSQMDREVMVRRNRERVGKEDAWLPRGKEKCWVGVAYFMGDPRVIERRLLKRGNWDCSHPCSRGMGTDFLRKFGPS